MLLQHFALQISPDCQEESELQMLYRYSMLDWVRQEVQSWSRSLVCTVCMLNLTYCAVVQPPLHCFCTRPRAQAATTCSLHTTRQPTRCPPSSHPGRPSCRSMPAMRQTPSSALTPLPPLKANPAPSQSVSPALLSVGHLERDTNLVTGHLHCHNEQHILDTVSTSL